MDERQAIQHSQYVFPYHHIPHLDSSGRGVRARTLDWGFEYLVYIDRILDIVAELSPAALLDVGCGDGYFLSRTPSAIDRTGIDTDEAALRFARAFCPDATFRNADILAPDRQYDVVTAIEVLEHIPDGQTADFLRGVLGWVRPGGSLVLSVPADTMPVISKHFRHYNAGLLERQIAEAAPDAAIRSIEYYYVHTFAERLYKRLTNNALLRGDIPALERMLWRHVRHNAPRADEKTGRRLIAVVDR